MGCCRYQATISYPSALLRSFCTLTCALTCSPLLCTCTSATTRHYHYHRHYHYGHCLRCVKRTRRRSCHAFTSSIGAVSILLVVRSSQRRELTKQVPRNLQHAFDVDISVVLFFLFWSMFGNFGLCVFSGVAFRKLIICF